MPKQFTLTKNERLKSRKQIDRLFAQGRSIVVSPFKIYYIAQEDPGKHRKSLDDAKAVLQFGVGVSAKNFKRSVERNRIKRLTREAWRLQKKELGDNLKAAGKRFNVFFIYTGKELPDFITVKNKVAVALKKLWSKINENNSANT